MTRLRRLLSVSGLLIALATSMSHADDKHRYRGQHEPEVQQDEIREAVKRMEIRPLTEISIAAEKAMPGQVVRVKAKRLQGALVYEFKIITEQGRVREVYINAATLEIMKIE